MNSLDGMIEISDTQAAAALLGLQAVVCTDSKVLVPIKESINWVKSNMLSPIYDGIPLDENKSPTYHEDDSDSDDEAIVLGEFEDE